MSIIEEKILERAREFGINEMQFNVPPKESMGDLSSPIAFRLAKVQGENPYKVAMDLKNKLSAEPIEHIKRISISEPGYVNFHIDFSSLSQEIFRQKISFPKREEKILIEHTNVNPNKAMHIGHLRNSIIGDTVARIYQKLGYKVEVLNYIDDTGVQLADIIVGMKQVSRIKWTEDQTYEEYIKKLDLGRSLDYYSWDLYTLVQQKYAENKELLKERQKVLMDLEERETSTAKFARKLAGDIVKAHLATVKRIEIDYDLLNWESDILEAHLWNEVFEKMKEAKAIVFEETGPNADCWVVKSEEEGDEEHVKDKILVRSDGTLTYTAKDIAYQLWKFGQTTNDFLYAKWDENTWTTDSEKGGKNPKNFGQADIVINVIDERQSYLQDMVRLSLENMGRKEEAKNSIHLAYGVVNLSARAAEELKVSQPVGGKGVAMSGRAGIGVKADDLLDMLEKILVEKTTKKIAKFLTQSAIRYYMLKFSLKNIIMFDFEDSIQTVGDTGIYLSYTYARANGIMKRAMEKISKSEFVPTELTRPEKRLLTHLGQFGTAFSEFEKDRDPVHLIRYIYQLSNAFNNFYENTEPIYRIENKKLKNFRLRLVQTYIDTTGEFFDLLGIPRLEKI